MDPEVEAPSQQPSASRSVADADAVNAALGILVPASNRRRVGRLEYLPGGYTNRNYRVEMGGETYALRVTEGRRGTGADAGPGAGGLSFRDVQARERQFLEIPSAPDVVAHDLDTGHLLTRWIDGTILARTPATPEEAGRYLAELHRQIPTGIRSYDYQRVITGMFRQAGRVDDLVATRFEELDWMPSHVRGCHNDLNPWNIIRVPGCGTADDGFRTLDWETAGDNDPLFDLAGLCLGLNWDLAKSHDCLEAYREASSFPATTSRRLAETLEAFVIREHAWAIAQIAAGNDRDEVREQARTTRQALRNLPGP